jgi:tRNA pseudouridine38-40 synthase
MSRAAKHLVGKRDFSAFQDQSGDRRDPVKTLMQVKVTVKKPVIEIDVKGSGFLNHMVRIIAGTLIEVGRGKIKPDAVKEILKSKDRKKSGPTAKASGLTLVKAYY